MVRVPLLLSQSASQPLLLDTSTVTNLHSMTAAQQHNIMSAP
jgi:hypothetical protein